MASWISQPRVLPSFSGTCLALKKRGSPLPSYQGPSGSSQLLQGISNGAPLLSRKEFSFPLFPATSLPCPYTSFSHLYLLSSSYPSSWSSLLELHLVSHQLLTSATPLTNLSLCSSSSCSSPLILVKSISVTANKSYALKEKLL